MKTKDRNDAFEIHFDLNIFLIYGNPSQDPEVFLLDQGLEFKDTQASFLKLVS